MDSKENKTEKAILVVSFGTTFKETREKTIGAIERCIQEAYPEYSVRRCFTSGMIISRLFKRDGLKIDNPEEAFQKAAGEGIREIVVQPTHLMDGNEYNKLMAVAENYKDKFEKMTVGAPLLTDEEDFGIIADAILNHLPVQGEKCAVLLMGHGTDAPSNAVYRRMEECLHKAGAKDHYIATVEGEPEIDDVLPILKEKGYEKVILSPFMIVAGDHATNDLAGDEEDSWKSILVREGYEVGTVLRGIGEWEEVQKLFVKHAGSAE